MRNRKRRSLCLFVFAMLLISCQPVNSYEFITAPDKTAVDAEALACDNFHRSESGADGILHGGGTNNAYDTHIDDSQDDDSHESSYLCNIYSKSQETDIFFTSDDTVYAKLLNRMVDDAGGFDFFLVDEEETILEFYIKMLKQTAYIPITDDFRIIEDSSVSVLAASMLQAYGIFIDDEERDLLEKGLYTFYKRLLSEKLVNGVLLDEALWHYEAEARWTENPVNKEDYIEASMKTLEDSLYYIFDVDCDGIPELGVRFPTVVLRIYVYDAKEDILVESIGRGTKTEVLGNGFILIIGGGAWSDVYDLRVVNHIDSKGAVEYKLSIDFIRDDPYDDLGIASSDVEQWKSASTYYIMNEGSTERIELTREQWEAMTAPIWEARRNAPKPLSYSEVID